MGVVYRATNEKTGRVAAVQRKRHLGEGEEAFTPGTESVACEHAGGSFGMVICAEAGYDGPLDPDNRIPDPDDPANFESLSALAAMRK